VNGLQATQKQQDRSQKLHLIALYPQFEAMDAAVGHVMEQAVLNAAQQLEDQLDQQIHTMENLDEDDIEKLRKGRIDVCLVVSMHACMIQPCAFTPDLAYSMFRIV
jgi:hypothetical protein